MPETIPVVRRFVEEYQSGGDESVAQALLDDWFVDHTPFPGFGPSREDVLELFRVLRAAFPDLRVEILHQFSDGDRVATCKVFRGTHRGEFAGIPPTGRPVQFRVMDFVRVVDGRIREHWNVADVPAMLDQLRA